ncbi:uncharacterized protein BXZ73DRAFT_103553 [Epithele typhae]|uniref:uncharacterized protein n=1 Tax=Epithele typhae TaxID=378194 RepID=UPI002007712A|nr:uncharacterized protein BXZ73DRAFT_103553 [Epithele typhae]KAH9924264.1 hypothetical protein BXZ73DRAFT_103553 [Epithele typhae]
MDSLYSIVVGGINSLAAHERSALRPIFGAILAIKTLCNLQVDGDLHHPLYHKSEDEQFEIHAPLTYFSHVLDEFRPQCRGHISETLLLKYLILPLCKNMESLELPVESAPLQEMGDHDWSQLRSLKLYGFPPSATALGCPLLGTLVRMPHLRSLSLQFHVPPSGDVEPIWPPKWADAPFPWPELEELFITNPIPEDGLWSRLPPTLRTLSMREWPPRWDHDHFRERVRDDEEKQSEYQARDTALSTAALCRILRQCRLPSLTSLGLGYTVYSGDGELVTYVGSAFPLLRVLGLYRLPIHGSECQSTDALTGLARQLLPLRFLHTLIMHVDQTEKSIAGLMDWCMVGGWEPQRLDFVTDVFERELPSIRQMAILLTDEYDSSSSTVT